MASDALRYLRAWDGQDILVERTGNGLQIKPVDTNQKMIAVAEILASHPLRSLVPGEKGRPKTYHLRLRAAGKEPEAFISVQGRPDGDNDMTFYLPDSFDHAPGQ